MKPGRNDRTAALLAAVPVSVLLALVAPRDGVAATEGRTSQGHEFVTGGISLGEREMLDTRRGEFSLWVVTAAKKSGAFMSDVQVVVTGKDGKTVLDTRLDGPWLMAKLAPGEYRIEARFREQRRSANTRVGPGPARQVFFYFDVDAEVGPMPDAKR